MYCFIYTQTELLIVSKCIGRRPNCLLIYSATNLQHVDVMRQLVIYLQSCNINVMIDILHIQDIVTKVNN